MKSIVLSKYSENFMSILDFDIVLDKVINDIKSERYIILDFKGISNVSPSFMTRLLNGLIENENLESIDYKNANSRLETTFNFALHSIKRKQFSC